MRPLGPVRFGKGRFWFLVECLLREPKQDSRLVRGYSGPGRTHRVQSAFSRRHEERQEAPDLDPGRKGMDRGVQDLENYCRRAGRQDLVAPCSTPLHAI